MRKMLIVCAAAAMAVAASVETYAVNVGDIVVKRGAVDTVYKAKHQIAGLAAPGEEFMVNGQSVKAYKTGTWGVELQLQPGENKITVEDNGSSSSFNIFYSTTPKPQVRDLAKEAEQAEKQKFYPTSLNVVTKKYAYLNYGAGTDRLGGAKINYLPEGIEMYADAENENLYRVRLSQNRYSYIPKSQVEVKGKYAPESDFMQSNVILSGSTFVTNGGDYDKVSIGLDGKRPYIVKEYADPHRIVVDLYGVQCNSNWLTHRGPLGSIDHIDVESIDSDITRMTVYLKTKSSWGFTMDYEGNNLNLMIKHVPDQLYLKNLTIGIDAGHGGPESNGAVGLSGMREKDMTLDMAFLLKGILEKQGAKVVLSRDSDVGVSMRERQDKFIEGGADIVLSIHCNAGGGPLSSLGTSTYYRYDVYKPLAEDILGQLTQMKDVNNFGMVGNFNFSLSAITDFPCVLVETLFISSLKEEEMLADPAFRQAMMENVAKGLADYTKECRIAEGQAKK
ncbi:MAG: N-acetylmuramoyl-L-alanine amidase [Bacteroidales bacterium]|nr:N-acetylmuramoyl-L-alanine amidase [Bacteroidales bacterium]